MKKFIFPVFGDGLQGLIHYNNILTDPSKGTKWAFVLTRPNKKIKVLLRYWAAGPPNNAVQQEKERERERETSVDDSSTFLFS